MDPSPSPPPRPGNPIPTSSSSSASPCSPVLHDIPLLLSPTSAWQPPSTPCSSSLDQAPLLPHAHHRQPLSPLAPRPSARPSLSSEITPLAATSSLRSSMAASSNPSSTSSSTFDHRTPERPPPCSAPPSSSSLTLAPAMFSNPRLNLSLPSSLSFSMDLQPPSCPSFLGLSSSRISTSSIPSSARLPSSTGPQLEPRYSCVCQPSPSASATALAFLSG